MNRLWPYLRIAAALLAITALTRQLAREIETARAATTDWGRDIPTAVSNYVSFFTVLSGLIAAVALLVGAGWMLRTRRENHPEPRWLAVLLADASTYMITTGIVYNLLLRGIPSHSATEAWTGEVMHVVLPVVMLADVLFAPRRRALGWRTALFAVIFPLTWGAYTLVRAPFITDPSTGAPYWYPYPFLDPHSGGGWPSVLTYIAVIAAGILLIAVLVVAVGRRRGAPHDHRPSTGSPPATVGAASDTAAATDPNPQPQPYPQPHRNPHPHPHPHPHQLRTPPAPAPQEPRDSGPEPSETPRNATVS